MWQSAILKDWRKVFAWIPVESLIKENQADYYKVLNVSDSNADSTAFIEFMLDLILNTIEEIIAGQSRVNVKVKVKVNVNQQKIISLLRNNPHATMEELSEAIGIAKKNIFNNMKKLQENGLLLRHGADKNGWWEVIEE